MPSSHLILCRPRLLPPSIFPSIRVFFIESTLWIRWPKCWSFSFRISPFNEYSGLMSFRVDYVAQLVYECDLKEILVFAHGPVCVNIVAPSIQLCWINCSKIWACIFPGDTRGGFRELPAPADQMTGRLGTFLMDVSGCKSQFVLFGTCADKQWASG